MARGWSHQEPVSSGATEGSVPARQLPPLSALDRRTDGARLGACPSCGGLRWWDNRSRKRAGQEARTIPDFVCIACRTGQRESDPPSTWKPNATQLPPAAAPAGAGGQRCQATKANGQPCGGSAMKGDVYCGPHSSHTGAPSRTCAGVTKGGKPCRAGVAAGETHCPQHRDQRP